MTLALAGRSSGKTITPEDLEAAGPVDPGGFLQFDGDAPDEAGEDEHAERHVVADVEQHQALHGGHQVGGRSTSVIGMRITCGGIISPVSRTRVSTLAQPLLRAGQVVAEHRGQHGEGHHGESP